MSYITYENVTLYGFTYLYFRIHSSSNKITKKHTPDLNQIKVDLLNKWFNLKCVCVKEGTE